MTAAPLLTTELLDDLAQRWRSQRAPVVEALRPGLSDSEMDALVRPLGLRLPHEARVWWAWHDGSSSMTDHALGLDLLFLPLEKTVSLYRTQMQIAAQVADGEDGLARDDAWPPGWLPLCTQGNGALMVADCDVADGAPTPIRHFHHEFGDPSRPPAADSLGTVVSWWIEAIDRGAWVYDREHRRWEEHPECLRDPRLARTGLV